MEVYRVEDAMAECRVEALEVHLMARSAGIYLWDSQRVGKSQISRLFSIPHRAGMMEFWSSLVGIGMSFEEAIQRGDEVESLYRARGSCILCPGDRDYPNRLYAMRHAPIVGVRGDVSLLRARQMAVVGSRKTASHAEEVTRMLVEFCVKRGVCITSGGAFGVDALAHRGAMQFGGATIVVSAMGTEQIYPVENRDIFEYARVHGVVMSQFPDRPVGHRPNFPLRNDVIAALSDGVVVVHCREKSGALYTLQAARRMNRRVFVAAMQGFDSLTEGGLGCVRRSQAELLSTMSQLEEIFPEGSEGVQRSLALPCYNDMERTVSGGMSDTHGRILDILKLGGLYREEIRNRLDAPPDLDASLLEMELNGEIAYCGGIIELRAVGRR